MADKPANQPTETEPTNNKPPSSSKETAGWRKPIPIILLLIIVVAGLRFGYGYVKFSATHAVTDDAQIMTDIIQISPQVSGTVLEVNVKDNQLVKKGDLLVVLDSATFESNVHQAVANLDAAIASAKGAGYGVTLTRETGSAQVYQAESVVQQAESTIASANEDVARSKAAEATARANAGSAQANISGAQAALDAAVSNRNRYDDAVVSAQAVLDTARAGVRASEASVEAAQAYCDKAERDAKRYASLVNQGAVSEQTSDAAQTTARSARAQLELAKQQAVQAQTTVAMRTADLNAAKQQQEGAVAAITQAKAVLKAAREQATAAKTGITQAEAGRGSALQAVRTAEARRKQASGQLTQAETTPRQVAVSRSAEAQALAKIEQARAALDSARIMLGYARIYAPADGRVNQKTVMRGALVQAGTPLMAIVPDNNRWVVANYKETQMDGIAPGRPAEVEVDAVPGRVFKGRVDSISSGTGATWALIPPDNATGNYTKVVQRVPVKIVLDDGQPDAEKLTTGMSVTAIVSVK